MRDHFDKTFASSLPLHVIQSAPMSTASPGVIRLLESRTHNTRNWQCKVFYKPISRFVPHPRRESALRRDLQNESVPVSLSANGVFRLFANCVPVKGIRRSTLCDLQNGLWCFIPNALHFILTELKDLTIKEIQAHFGSGDHLPIIDGYFRFLIGNEFGFICDEPERFPCIDFSFVRPEQITNAIIDVDKNSDHPWDDILSQLSDLGCRALQLRFFSETSAEQLDRILHMTHPYTLCHIDVVVPYLPGFSDQTLLQIVDRYPAVSKINVHSAPATRDIESPPNVKRVFFTHERCESSSHCGLVHAANFVVNMEHFSEAQDHNTCLNRKISIDAHGTIRNCPAFSISYGNVRSVRLAEAVGLKTFQDPWKIRKDDIKICRSCEFRYICTDCRAFLSDSSDVLSKPATCSYDPSSAAWSDDDA